MNEDLAIKILEIITKGETFGFTTVLNEVRQLPEYFDLTQPDFTITWNKLKEINCLLRHDQGRDCVKLNPTKDCLTIYLKRRDERLAALNPINQPNEEHKAPQQNKIARILKWVMNNPMSTTIIGGLIALIVGTLILKHYHII